MRLEPARRTCAAELGAGVILLAGGLVLVCTGGTAVAAAIPDGRPAGSLAAQQQHQIQLDRLTPSFTLTGPPNTTEPRPARSPCW
ncbi:MAG: hypothetical protein ACRDPK_00405 [Carbonactinosporaceae bacterium]